MGWTKPLKKLLYALPAPAFWLGVWQVCAFLVDRSLDGKGNELRLPYPLSVWNALAAMVGTGEFWAAVLTSLGRIALGLAWGVLLGAALAVLTCASQWTDRLLSPAVRVVRATPVVSFILLVYLWTPRTAIPWVIAGLMVLPVVWGALSSGLDSLDGRLLELARAYRFSRWKTLRLIYLPGLRPHLSAGLLTAFGLAWKSGVAAEVLCPPDRAIGSRIQQAKLGLETADLFAWTLTIVALSLLLEGLLRRGLERRWKT